MGARVKDSRVTLPVSFLHHTRRGTFEMLECARELPRAEVVEVVTWVPARAREG